MIRGLLGKKVGMTQIFDNDGNFIPLTVIETGPCTILGLIDSPIKKVRVGFQSLKENKSASAQKGEFKKLNVAPVRYVREFFSTENKDYKVGQELKADVFKAGDYVDVTGISIGKGFQGGMKRWGWSGGPAGHGSMHHRRVGSISSSADPSRTFRGRHMPGHMGARTITVQGLRVMTVSPEDNYIAVKGAIPGHKNGIVSIRISNKKAFKSLDEKKAVVVHKVNPMKQSKAKAGGAAKAKPAKPGK